STILDLSRDTPVLLRPGAISADAIAQVIGRRPRSREEGQSDAPRVSGELAAHYAPSTPLELIASDKLVEAMVRHGGKVAVLAHGHAPAPCPDCHWQAVPADPAGYAHDLYATLRALDSQGFERILVEAPPADPAWQAVRDRLGRAATGSGIA